MPVAYGVSRFPVLLRGIHQTCYLAQTFARTAQKKLQAGAMSNAMMAFAILEFGGNYTMLDSVGANHSFYIVI